MPLAVQHALEILFGYVNPMFFVKNQFDGPLSHVQAQ